MHRAGHLRSDQGWLEVSDILLEEYERTVEQYGHLLPSLAGYVGADHVAMLLATGVAQSEGVVLAIDIGTSTEVCLANHGTLTSISCATGPAFEGAYNRHGMRASPGAIEHLRLVEDQVEY